MNVQRSAALTTQNILLTSIRKKKWKRKIWKTKENKNIKIDKKIRTKEREQKDVWTYFIYKDNAILNNYCI